MPDVSQKEVGRRLYHVHREKRVERAVKLIQRSLKSDWKLYSENDVHVLGHLLQCTWNIIEQKEWEKIPFSHMTNELVQKILSYGEGVGPGKNPDPEAVEEIKKILINIS